MVVIAFSDIITTGMDYKSSLYDIIYQEILDNQDSYFLQGDD